MCCFEEQEPKENLCSDCLTKFENRKIKGTIAEKLFAFDKEGNVLYERTR